MQSRRVRRIGLFAVIAALTVAILTIGCPTLAQDAAVAPQAPAAPASMNPKNIIVMIADGGGFNQYATGSMYEHGEEANPLYSEFPVQMGMSTYPAGGSYQPEEAAEDMDYVGSGATDSAAAATAMATGTKTYSGAIGVNEEREPITNATEAAEAAGKASGVVTSVQIAHATPAGFVAHEESRSDYEAIARDMILDSAVDVIMGAGHPAYNNDSQPVPEDDRNYAFVGGEQTWEGLQAGTVGGDANGDGQPDPWTLVDTLQGFENLATGHAPDRVLGMAPVASTLQQRRSGDATAAAYQVPFTEGVPSLELMTRGALNVLSHDPDGFFLMVEGGAVDWAGHSNQCGRLIEEQIAFNQAVAAVVDWVERESSWDDTLLIVTADHETGYLTGPEARQYCDAPVCCGKGEMPTVEWHSGSHTNQLVPFYARGAGAQVFEDAAIGTDPVRGPYVDNTFIGSIVISAMQQ